MVKRVAVSSLWFLAVGWGLNYAVVFLGVAPIIGFAFSAAIAAFVGIDPLHLFWPAPAPTPAVVERVAEPMSVPGVVQHNA